MALASMGGRYFLRTPLDLGTYRFYQNISGKSPSTLVESVALLTWHVAAVEKHIWEAKIYSCKRFREDEDDDGEDDDGSRITGRIISAYKLTSWGFEPLPATGRCLFFSAVDLLFYVGSFGLAECVGEFMLRKWHILHERFTLAENAVFEGNNHGSGGFVFA